MERAIERLRTYTVLRYIDAPLHPISNICSNKNVVSKCIEKRVKPGKGCGSDSVLSTDLKIVGPVAAEGLTKVLIFIPVEDRQG